MAGAPPLALALLLVSLDAELVLPFFAGAALLFEDVDRDVVDFSLADLSPLEDELESLWDLRFRRSTGIVVERSSRQTGTDFFRAPMLEYLP